MQIRGRSRPDRSSRNWLSGQSTEPGAIWMPPRARIRWAWLAIRRASLEPDPGRRLPIEHVDRIDEANGLGLVGHDQRVGAGAAPEEAHSLEQVAGRHAGRREHEVLARGQVLGPVDAALVAVAHPRATGPLVVVAVPEAGLDLAAEAAHRRGGDHALRRAADAHHRMHAGAGDRAADRGRQVAVADELDPGAGTADLGDQALVPGPVEND